MISIDEKLIKHMDKKKLEAIRVSIEVIQGG